MTAAALPIEVADLTPAWFSYALGRDVTAVTVLDQSSGTTGRARVALQGEPGVPPSVFVKLPPIDEAQRVFVDMTGMGVAEARFYRDLAAEVAVRVPSVWYSQTDGHDYVMVLEDLVASGCRFPAADDLDVAARARDIVEQLAALHAPYWGSERFAAGNDLEWLASRSLYRAGDGGRVFVEQAIGALGDQMDADFHRIAEMYVDRSDAIVALWDAGEHTLLHGDTHLGNLFVDTEAGDRTGFLDWAVVGCAPGMRDLAYVMTNSVPAEVREGIERELVDRYCTLLAGAGVALDRGDAWDQYRLFALYSWVAATATAGMGSKWQPIEIGIAATKRATAACTHLGCVDLVRSKTR